MIYFFSYHFAYHYGGDAWDGVGVWGLEVDVCDFGKEKRRESESICLGL